jgi:hypothetical protein
MRHHRHPVVEAVVFAAALLLATFVGRELWRRRAPEVPVAPEPVLIHEAAIPTQMPLPPAAGIRRTETAVGMVPPIKLSRVQRRKPKTSVPAPK